MGHIHGPEDPLTSIIPPHYSMNHHGYGYSDHILDCIICYPIFIVTSHSTVPDSLALGLYIYGKLIGIVYHINCVVAIH